MRDAVTQQLHRRIIVIRRQVEHVERCSCSHHHAKQGRVGEREADIGSPDSVEPGSTSARIVHRSKLQPAQFRRTFIAQRTQQGRLIGKVPINRSRTDADHARNFAQTDFVCGTRFQQLQASLHQRRTQITMVISTFPIFNVDTVIFARHVIAVNIAESNGKPEESSYGQRS